MPLASLASFAQVAPSLWNALDVPSIKVPIKATTFVSYILPPVVCYFAAALLAVTPRTRAVRVALWPLIALLALRAALSVEMTLGNPERKFLDVDMVLLMFFIATRTFDWTLAKGPLVRHLRPGNSPPSIIMDGFDLAFNFRGHGWEWSRGLYIPRGTRPANRIAFAFCAFLSAIAHILMCGAVQRVVVTLSPVGIGSIPGGSTIFDETLPFPVRCLRASIISILTAFEICAVMQMGCDVGATAAVLVLGQDPAQWPPIFDAPWRATSLGDFWGHRWHQLFRQTFLLLGGRPLSFVVGRSGMVVGGFLASAVFHHIMMVALNSQAEFWWMLVGFGMMAPGILAERAFHQFTGRRVGGVLGWLWTMGWLLLWGSVIIEGYARAGTFGCSGFIDSWLPVRISVEHLAAGFDAWLHTI